MRRISTRSARAREQRIVAPPPAVFPPVNTRPPAISSGWYQYPAFNGAVQQASSPGFTLVAMPGLWDETDGPVVVTGRWLRLGPVRLQYGNDNDPELVVTSDMTGYVGYVETAARDGVVVEKISANRVAMVAQAPLPNFMRVAVGITGSTRVGEPLTKPEYVWAIQTGLGPLNIVGEWWKNGSPTGVTTPTYDQTTEGDLMYWIETATNIVGGSTTGPALLLQTPTNGMWDYSSVYVSSAIDDIRTGMRSEVVSRITGLAGGSVSMNRFTDENHQTLSYTDNMGMWCYDLKNQMTAHMVGTRLVVPHVIAGSIQAGYGVTLITPRHALVAGHTGGSVNSDLRRHRFKTHDGRIVEAMQECLAAAGGIEVPDIGPPHSDLGVVLLDRDMRAEGCLPMPIFGGTYLEWAALRLPGTLSIPFVGFSQSGRTAPASEIKGDYPANHKRMLYVGDTVDKDTGTTDPVFDDFRYGVYKGDSGCAAQVLTHSRFFILGPLSTGFFGYSPAGTSTSAPWTPAGQEILNRLIARVDEIAVEWGRLSEPTGLLPVYVTPANMPTHPVATPLTASPSPARHWCADPVDPIASRVQTNPTAPTINIRSARVLDPGNITTVFSNQRVLGTVKEGPLFHYDNGFFWYRINFDNGTAGWVEADNLQNVTTNAVPVATGASVNALGGASINISLQATDTDNTSLTFSITIPPTKGLLTLSGNTATYTPAQNQSGADSFQFTASDGEATSPAATININIVAANRAPVAFPQSINIPEETATAITLDAADADGDTLVYSIVSGPSNGVLSGSGSIRTYTPDAAYNGPDSFTFKANDGIGDSNIATVTINVTPENDRPVANPQSISTTEDTTKAFILTGYDAEGQALTYAIASNPTKGTIYGTGANRIYTPNLNATGADSFTFTVSDGTLTSAPATVSVSILALNDVPVANPQSISTVEDTPVAVVLTGQDAEGVPLVFTIVDAPTNGTISSGSGANRVYTPNANAYGLDSFTFTVSDGVSTSAPATVDVTILAVNDRPVANGQSLSVAENGSVGFTMTGYDVEGAALTYTIVTAPSKGTISGTGSSRTYTPTAEVNGYDSFTFTVSDGVMTSDPATVIVNILADDAAPTANPQSISIVEDTAKDFTLAGYDPEGQALTFAIVDAPSKGVISGTGATRTYTPNLNATGADSFTFTVSDGVMTSAPATVSVSILAVNDAPVANAQSVSTNEDTSKVITLTATDPEGNPLTYSIVTGPTRGSLTGTPPNVTYVPTGNLNGPDSFTFRVFDGTAYSAPATVNITVFSVNDAPVANAQSVSTNEDTSKAITLTGTDVEGAALTYAIVAGPSNGTLTGTPPNVTYVPNANFFGSDSFTFRVNDGTTNSSTATVNITVVSVNDTPIANAQTVSTNEDTPLAITLTGTDVEGAALTYEIVSGPSNGTITPGTGAGRTYTPNSNFVGTDSFAFRVNDGTTNSPAVTVNIAVVSVNDRPVADAQTVSTNETVSKAITLTGTDVEGAALTYAIVAGPTRGSLTGTPPNVTYVPTGNLNGPDSFTFTVSDGILTSTPATVNVTVIPVNFPPVALAQTVGVAYNTATSITLTASDVDGDSLIYIRVTQPAHGSLSGTDPNLTYTPDTDYSGPDSFTFKVNDGTSDSSTVTVTINVAPPTGTLVPKLLARTNYSIAGFSSQETVNEPAPATAAIDGNTNTFWHSQWRSPAAPPPHWIAIDLGGVHQVAGLNYLPRQDGGTNGIFGSHVIEVSLDNQNWTVVYSGAWALDTSLKTSMFETPVEARYVAITSPDTLRGSAAEIGIYTMQSDIPLPNNPPVANARSYISVGGETVAIVLTGTDADGDTLTYEIVTPPTSGSLTGVAPNLVYAPTLGQYGEDSFEFRVNDGEDDSATAVIRIERFQADPDTIVTNSISKDGVTWVFDSMKTCGRYCNGPNGLGDWWVLGDVTIIDILPHATPGRNGTMVNPAVGAAHGFDDRIASYDPGLNAGLDVPSLFVPANSSVVSCVSKTAYEAFVQVDAFVVLTVVAVEPSPRSFRPHYIGSASRASQWRYDDVDVSALGKLSKTPFTSLPDINTVKGYFEKTWYEQDLSATGRNMRASYMAPSGFGGDMAGRTADAALLLQLDYTDAEKKDLLTNLVQYGLDNYNMVDRWTSWNEDGGHNHGRLAPYLVACAVINDSQLRTWLPGEHGCFQEYRQTFFVSDEDIALSHTPVNGAPYENYTSTDKGLPEWGVAHRTNALNDNKRWDAPYRDVNGNKYAALTMAARVMGIRFLCNWEPLFKYAERHVDYEQSAGYGGEFSSNPTTTFHKQFYNAYVGLFTDVDPTVIQTRSVSRNGVTWYFNALKKCGQYCNGDWWVEGPVTINNITPVSEVRVESLNPGVLYDNKNTFDRIVNGTTVNLELQNAPDTKINNAFDNAISKTGKVNVYAAYSDENNVAPSRKGPLYCPADTTVVSSISLAGLPAQNSSNPQIGRIAMLTVVSPQRIPVAGSFRPSPFNTAKVSNWNKIQLNYQLLRKLSMPSSAPSFATVEGYFAESWTTFHVGNAIQSMSPSEQMPNYGRDQANRISDALFLLHSNASDAQKERLYIALIQYGIDIYGYLTATPTPGFYRGSGGLNPGHKAPLVLAATVLNDTGMKSWASGTKYVSYPTNPNKQVRPFLEDSQIWYVESRDLTRPLQLISGRLNYPYDSRHLGLAEWGNEHEIYEPYDGSYWYAYYRDINGGVHVGNALGIAMLVGGKAVWNNTVFFDYCRRYWAVEGDGTVNDQSFQGNTIQEFHFDMLKLYNNTYHLPWGQGAEGPNRDPNP